MKLKKFAFITGIFLFASCGEDNNIDAKLEEIIKTQNLKPISFDFSYNENKFKLGQALFFDKLLSGNKDISCATCHHPQFGTVDCKSLGAGTKGEGLCSDRIKGEGREFVPRNSPDIFNRGLDQWHTMFWDGRIQILNEKIQTPAGDQTPAGLENVLAAQALFPITSRTEMRGLSGDIAVDGSINEIAQIEDGNFNAIWYAVLDRVLSIQEYREMFKKAYPGKTKFSIVDYANAVATFEAVAFFAGDSPWDEYLKGDKDALSEDAKKGAVIFFSKGKCYTCHSGVLFTDQKFHNLAVPQFGPGKDPQTGLDMGRYHVTKDPQDKYKFRTPTLRNLLITAPYFHNGAYSSLKKVIKHHIDPEGSLRNYNPLDNDIPENLAQTFKSDESTIIDILQTVDVDIPYLTDEEIDYIISFLKALTSPKAYNLDLVVPETVPSGLPVDKL